MTQEDIIRMAREANRHADTHADSKDCDWPLVRDTHLAALVAAAEREACAKFADQYMRDYEGKSFGVGNAIRARGETK